MLGDAQLERLKRRFESDPDDLEALLRYIDGLRRLEQPFLDLALHGVSKGIPIGPEGIQRDWFRVYWKPIVFRLSETARAELAGPFVDLSHRSLNFAELSNVDLRYARFHMSELKGLSLTQCQLQHSDFTDCDFSELLGGIIMTTQFSGVDFSDSDFSRSLLRGVTFQDSSFQRASFQAAKMVGAFLYSCHFDNANLQSAKLDSCRAYDCQFQNARFNETSIDGLIFDGETKWPAGFDPFSHGALAEL